jgi:hypothetical protein
MKKENSDDKLTTFLRTNKPDVPTAAHGFEDKLLNATVRRSWRSRFNALIQPKWRYAFSFSVAALLIILAVNRPDESTQNDVTPVIVVTQTKEVNLNDEDIYSFFVESMDGVQGNQNTDVLAEIDLI